MKNFKNPKHGFCEEGPKLSKDQSIFQTEAQSERSIYFSKYIILEFVVTIGFQNWEICLNKLQVWNSVPHFYQEFYV